MADRESVTLREALGKVIGEEHADVVRESVAWFVRELMEVEVSELAGAGLGQKAPGERVTHRNGYRPRGWETRVGEIELQIPRKRSGGSYFPSFLEPRRRCEQAIVAVVMEAYVNGVSTTQGRPAGRADGHPWDDQGSCLGAVSIIG